MSVEIPGFASGDFVQFIADNVDHNIRTLEYLPLDGHYCSRFARHQDLHIDS